MDSQKKVLRQAQHERNINTLRQYPFVLSLSKHFLFHPLRHGRDFFSAQHIAPIHPQHRSCHVGGVL